MIFLGENPGDMTHCHLLINQQRLGRAVTGEHLDKQLLDRRLFNLLDSDLDLLRLDPGLLLLPGEGRQSAGHANALPSLAAAGGAAAAEDAQVVAECGVRVRTVSSSFPALRLPGLHLVRAGAGPGVGGRVDAEVRDVARPVAGGGEGGQGAVLARDLPITLILDLLLELGLQHRQLPQDGVQLLVLTGVEVDEAAPVLPPLRHLPLPQDGLDERLGRGRGRHASLHSRTETLTTTSIIKYFAQLREISHLLQRVEFAQPLVQQFGRVILVV